MDRQDLNEFIGENLHELAWRKNYPLDGGIAGWTILGALKGIGFAIIPEQNSYKIFRVFNYGKKNYSLSTNITNEELLVGWNNQPRASPKALYSSVYKIIDKFDEQVNSHFTKWKTPLPLANYLSEQRKTLGFKARDIMEQYLLEYFGKYQEAVLASLNGKGHDELKPRILDELIASDVISLERINYAIAYTRFEDRLLSNLSETIGFLKDGQPIEDESYVIDKEGGVFGYRGISESGAFDYVWGSYLLKLAELKGYSIIGSNLEDPESKDEVLEMACDLGWNALEELRVI